MLLDAFHSITYAVIISQPSKVTSYSVSLIDLSESEQSQCCSYFTVNSCLVTTQWILIGHSLQSEKRSTLFVNRRLFVVNRFCKSSFHRFTSFHFVSLRFVFSSLVATLKPSSLWPPSYYSLLDSML